MAYTHMNYPTKKALREAVARGEEVTIFQPGLGAIPTNGVISLEGPHYPKPHTWYAQTEVKDGLVVKVN